MAMADQAEQVEARVRKEVDDLERRLRNDPVVVGQWIRQNNLIYGGLIGIGVVMVQPFLGAPSLDLAATISVVGFALAIPILGALVMLNEQEASRRRMIESLVVDVLKAGAQFAAIVGVVAGFWHISWIAGIGIIVGGVFGLAAISAGYRLPDGSRISVDP